MFYFALVACGVLLLAANLTYRLSKSAASTAGVIIGTTALSLVCMVVLPPAGELGLALLLILAGTAIAGRPRLFLPLSLAAFVIVMGGNTLYAWVRTTEMERLYGFESLADRLPERSASGPELSLPAVERLEDELVQQERFLGRRWALERLHTDTTRLFLSQPNFGVGRMTAMSEHYLRNGERHDPPLPQPPARLTSGGFDLLAAGKPIAPDSHQSMHEAGVLDFVHPDGFGYVKDRDHVAGFQPHQFRKPPEPGKALQLRSLDLIGLVVHPEPVAYVSANLPRMDELRTNPTRPLTAFEAEGLKELQAGKELVARESPGGLVRLLGSIRNANQCQACHGGRRGELLGAFAYELVPR